MWQEARKQEKIVRGIMVDYKRRAERRKGFYDKIKKDPAEFMQVWGRAVKIHIDPNLASAADNPSIMTKWRGDDDTLIDRFDVRSHLDFYVEYKEPANYEASLTESDKNEERMLNYERYRTLVQNEAVGVTEKQCLKQIEIDEKFGSSTPQEKKPKEQKAQIGYTYQDSSYVAPAMPSPFGRSKSPEAEHSDELENEEDLDLALDIKKLTSEHKVILNKCATNYGMEFGDYIRILILEGEEKEKIKQNKLLEAEKAQYSGRKSRRERRIVKDRLRKEKGEISPLSYIVAEKTPEKDESDSSRSNSSSASSKRIRRKSKNSATQDSSPTNKVMFITSFGADDDNENEKDIQDILLTKNNSNLKTSTLGAVKKSDESISNLKRIKQNATLSMLRSKSSRSRSRSPSFNKDNNKSQTNNTKRKNTSDDSMDSNDESGSTDTSTTSDEEEALKKYLKRRESRKQMNLHAKTSSIVSLNQASSKTNDLPTMETASKQMAVSISTTSTNAATIHQNNILNKNNGNKSNLNISNDNNGNLSNKFRSADEFKLYQEKLKKKMQNQINKQLKKDKEMEKEKKKKERNERREREAELNYLTEKMRQRRALERRKNRRKDGLASSSSSSERSDKEPAKIYHTRSKSRSRSKSRLKSRSRSRSRSKSRNRSARKEHRSRTRSRSRNRRRSDSRSNSRVKRRSRSSSERYRNYKSNKRRNSSNSSRRSSSIRRNRSARRSTSSSPSTSSSSTSSTSTTSKSKSSSSSSSTSSESSSD